MLNRWKVDVVRHGQSLHDGDSYDLMRAFASLEDREQSEDAFYGGDEWKLGPREAILAKVEFHQAQCHRSLTPARCSTAPRTPPSKP